MSASAGASPDPPSPHPRDRGPRLATPSAASGAFDLAKSSLPRRGHGDALSYRVEVERGLPVTAASFAEQVDAVLRDRRGWTRGRRHSFVQSPAASTRIVLASPATVDRLCAPLRTGGRLSCRNGDDIVLNAWRWFRGAPSYRSDLLGYRTYLVNHEVGHRLGRPHRKCPRPGAAAPVMLQQTKSLSGCEANPWPR